MPLPPSQEPSGHPAHRDVVRTNCEAQSSRQTGQFSSRRRGERKGWKGWEVPSGARGGEMGRGCPTGSAQKTRELWKRSGDHCCHPFPSMAAK